MRMSNPKATNTDPRHDSLEIQHFERQLQRYNGDGDCAYERSLNQLYRRLFEQRCSQLDALRKAGL